MLKKYLLVSILLTRTCLIIGFGGAAFAASSNVSTVQL